MSDDPVQYGTQPRFVIVTIPGRPTAKGRPRFARGRAVTPQATRDAEATMAQYMRLACPEPLAGPLDLRVWFEFRRPDSWPKAERDRVDEHEDESWYQGRPDLDNLVKLALDSANGILFADDAQIVHLEADKVYGSENQTVINLQQAEGGHDGS